MSYFVVGYDLSFLLAHDTVFLLFTNQYLFYGIEQILLAHQFSALFYRIDGSLVDHIGKVGAYCTAGCKCDGIQIYGIIHQHILGMHLQNFHTALQIRFVYNNSSVEASRTQQCFIQNLRSVGGCQNNDTFLAIKAVHFNQKLVQRLLALVMAATKTGTSSSCNSIYFINKNNTWCVLLCLTEQISDTGCTHTYIQFDKVRAGKGEKGNMSFSGYGFCQKRLTCSGRAYQQRTLR